MPELDLEEKVNGIGPVKEAAEKTKANRWVRSIKGQKKTWCFLELRSISLYIVYNVNLPVLYKY